MRRRDSFQPTSQLYAPLYQLFVYHLLKNEGDLRRDWGTQYTAHKRLPNMPCNPRVILKAAPNSFGSYTIVTDYTEIRAMASPDCAW
jgi:hypothetical protein